MTIALQPLSDTTKQREWPAPQRHHTREASQQYPFSGAQVSPQAARTPNRGRRPSALQQTSIMSPRSATPSSSDGSVDDTTSETSLASAQISSRTKLKTPTSDDDDSKSCLDKLCLFTWRACMVLLVYALLNVLVYFVPMGQKYSVDPKVAPYKPRPKFVGSLGVNDALDARGEKLWENQFHAPESMAWTRDRRHFYTGVEGGFILLVEPEAERWTVAAQLNARGLVEDKSAGVEFVHPSSGATIEINPEKKDLKWFDMKVPFCTKDIELYGSRAEFEPALVRLSRCSRPLGLRLSPDESRLYVIDPLSGMWKIAFANNLSDETRTDSGLRPFNRAFKLLDFSQFNSGGRRENERPSSDEQVYFADDIAVEWAPDGQDIVYFTDCSRRWSLRYLVWLIAENDDSGRVMRFDVGKKRLSQLQTVVPVGLEQRNLSFPNGLELIANGSALLISDLNNRRILMHHLKGPLEGQTKHLMWVPGFPDNIKRGLDTPDGQPTYWFACGCAVSDGQFELTELTNSHPWLRRLALHWLYLAGSLLDLLGRALSSTWLRDAALEVGAAWLKHDPYCTHGLVAQFNERGEILRSLHGPSFSSNFKLLSEASQVPLPRRAGKEHSVRSALYLGSVYYNFLGRIELDENREPAREMTSS